jgi:tetratricopeptide (TPR) repeat protein
MRISRVRLVLGLPAVVCVALAAGCHGQTADDHLRKAEDYLAHSQLQEAIVELRLAEQADPKRGDVREKLADAYLRVPDLLGAYREYIRGADLLPSDAHAQLMAGQLLLSARQFEDAKARANKAIALDAKNVDAEILLGNAMAGLKDLDGAIAEYRDAITLDPAQDTAYANIGTIQIVRGQKDQAEASFRKAVEVAPKSVPARLALANFLWASGRAPDAEQALKDALALDPANLSANSALGAFYMASNRIKEAEVYYQAIARTANTTPAILGLADYYAVAKRIPDARHILDALAAKNNDGYAAAVVRLAALDATEGQRAQAEGRLNDLLDKKPKDMSARLLLARLMAVDGKSDEALKGATSIVTDEPTSTATAPAYLLIGQIQASRDRPEEAIAAYKEAIKRESQPVAADAALATLSLRTGAYDQAATYSQQALAIMPGNPGLRVLQVRVLLAQGKTAQAKDEIASLQKAYPNSPIVINLLAGQQLTGQQMEAARASYAKAAALAPNNLEALAGLVRIDLATGRNQEALARVEAGLKGGKPTGEFLMLAGRTYAAAGNLPKAEEMLRRAIEAQPARLEAYGMLGSLYVAEHRLADAEDQFRRVTTENPRSEAAGTMLGMILEAEKKVPDAEKQYKAVLAADGQAAVAANNLAWIYVSGNRNLDEALQLAQTAVRRLPDEPHVNDTLGWIYYRKNMASEAVRYLEASVKSDPNDPATHYHLGMAYVGAGDLTKGRESLRQALAMKGDFDGASDAKKALGQIGG